MFTNITNPVFCILDGEHLQAEKERYVLELDRKTRLAVDLCQVELSPCFPPTVDDTLFALRVQLQCVCINPTCPVKNKSFTNVPKIYRTTDSIISLDHGEVVKGGQPLQEYINDRMATFTPDAHPTCFGCKADVFIEKRRLAQAPDYLLLETNGSYNKRPAGMQIPENLTLISGLNTTTTTTTTTATNAIATFSSSYETTNTTGVNYRRLAVIYYGQTHYRARIQAWSSQDVYDYDGLVAGGAFIKCSGNVVWGFTILKDYTATLLMYQRITPRTTEYTGLSTCWYPSSSTSSSSSSSSYKRTYSGSVEIP
jgi:hypothetical protein